MALVPVLEEDVLWILQHLPRELLSLLKTSPGLVLAGGCFRACVAHEPIQDFDVCANDVASARAAANLLAKASGSPYKQTDNAFTLLGYSPPIQVIHRWTFTDLASCVESFDFTIAKAGLSFTSANEWVALCDERFYADLAARRLHYCAPIRSEDAGGSLLRVLKFYQRGYRIPLPSLAAVVARLCASVKFNRLLAENGSVSEEAAAQVILGLLREVDPLRAFTAADPADATR